MTVEDKQEKDVDMIQKLQAAVSVMPNNAALMGIYKKNLLAFAGLTSDEIKIILESEMLTPEPTQMAQEEGLMGAEAQGMEMPQLSPAMSSQAQEQADLTMPDLMGGQA